MMRTNSFLLRSQSPHHFLVPNLQIGNAPICETLFRLLYKQDSYWQLINLDDWMIVKQIVPSRTVSPMLRFIYQPALDRIKMNVLYLLDEHFIWKNQFRLRTLLPNLVVARCLVALLVKGQFCKQPLSFNCLMICRAVNFLKEPIICATSGPNITRCRWLSKMT